MCAKLATQVLILVRNNVFLPNSMYSSRKTLQLDLDNVLFYLNNAEFNCQESTKWKFLVKKL